MTAPVLAHKKFWIVKPKAGVNQIKNPSFAGPEFITGWTASGAGVTIASHPDEARRGAYSQGQHGDRRGEWRVYRRNDGG